ncbi:MAG: TMEM165/GDT1 family protein [Candidatus Ranarchaeia archaeon]
MQTSVVIIIVFITIFIAEMGDKTQLATISLGATSSFPKITFLGVIFGLSVVTLVGGLIGSIMGLFIPLNLMRLTAAGLFIIMGLWTLLPCLSQNSPLQKKEAIVAEENGSSVASSQKLKLFIQAFALIFLMEMGDKTQFMIIVLSASLNDLTSVMIGGLTALVTVNAIGVIIGQAAASKFPKKKVDIIAGLLFIALGLVLLFFPF